MRVPVLIDHAGVLKLDVQILRAVVYKVSPTAQTTGTVCISILFLRAVTATQFSRCLGHLHLQMARPVQLVAGVAAASEAGWRKHIDRASGRCYGMQTRRPAV